jgi:hypothetical protein
MEIHIHHNTDNQNKTENEKTTKIIKKEYFKSFSCWIRIFIIVSFKLNKFLYSMSNV